MLPQVGGHCKCLGPGLRCSTAQRLSPKPKLRKTLIGRPVLLRKQRRGSSYHGAHFPTHGQCQTNRNILQLEAVQVTALGCKAMRFISSRLSNGWSRQMGSAGRLCRK